MKPLDTLTNSDLEGKRVLVRVDFNVPVQNGVVLPSDMRRIDASLETIDYLTTSGAKVILISHFGQKGESLQSVFDAFNTLRVASFAHDIGGAETTELMETMRPGDILLLENIRMNDAEEKNTTEFAETLSKLGDIYVNDAFSASHREHASIVGLPKLLPAYMGFQFEREYRALSRVLETSGDMVVIMAGAKFSTKLPIMEQFLPRTKALFVGGALLNTLFQARGYSVGQSLIDPSADVSRLIVSRSLILPDRVIVDRLGARTDVMISEIQPMDKIMDIAPSAVDRLGAFLGGAKTVIWNGPLGVYEQGYTSGSERLAELIQTKTTRAFTVVGGGDTTALIDQKSLGTGFSFISTAGGAMLDFLAEGTLPGIKALEESAK